MEYLLELLQKIDKKISDKERALLHLKKQEGRVISSLRSLKEEREKAAVEYQKVL